MTVNLLCQAIPFTGAATQQAFTGRSLLAGWTIRETAGAVCVVRIWDGVSAAGTILADISLAANGSSDVFFSGAVEAHVGLFVEKVSGTFEGSVRVA